MATASNVPQFPPNLPSGMGSPVIAALAADWTLADLRTHLGGVGIERIRLFPSPGLATEDDVVRLCESKEALCELVDGVLVEKIVGIRESRLAAMLIFFIETYLQDHPLGFTLSPDGPVRTVVPKVRMPDVSFVSWDHFPDRQVPEGKILPFAPDLAVEVLSQSNTPAEMKQKLAEYFQADAKLV